LYDNKGRYTLVKVSGDEANIKLCRVQKLSKAKKASIGRNPFQTGQAATIPYIVTHDGRTIRYCDPLIKANDTVKIDITTGKVVDHVKFDLGNVAMITAGNNIGRVGIIQIREKHPGSFDIIHLKDKRGNEFATRMQNVFVIGDSAKPWVTIPKAKGLRYTIQEQKDAADKSK